jgi:hypothetical protein
MPYSGSQRKVIREHDIGVYYECKKDRIIQQSIELQKLEAYISLSRRNFV